MTFSITTFSIMTFSTMTFTIITFSITTFNITTFSIMILSKKCDIQLHDIQLNTEHCYAVCQLCSVSVVQTVTYETFLKVLQEWNTFQVLHSRVGAWPYPQTLDWTGKACQG